MPNKNRITKIISQDLSGISEFQENIVLPFNARYMIVRAVAYVGDASEVNLGLLRLMNTNDLLCYFGESAGSNNPSSYFLAPSDLNLRFQVLDSAKALDSTRNGVLSLMIEFED